MRLIWTSRWAGLWLACGLLWGCGLLVAPGASAAGPSGAVVGLRVTGSHHPYFVLSGRPGKAVRRSVTVVNAGGRRAAIRLYATDATTGQTSGAVYLSAGHRPHGVGAWIHLSRRQLTLGPHQRANVPFRVVVPAGASGGQHLGGIVAAPVQPRARLQRDRGKASFGVIVREQTVIAVEANLPGARVKRLTITGIHPSTESGAQTLLVGLASIGNALTHGTGAITVYGPHGATRVKQRFALDTFVPRTRIDYPVLARGHETLGPGRYRARIRVAWAGHHVTRTLAFTIKAKNLTRVYGYNSALEGAHGDGGGGDSSLPWIIVAVVAGLAVLGAGYSLGTRRRGPRHQAP